MIKKKQRCDYHRRIDIVSGELHAREYAEQNLAVRERIADALERLADQSEGREGVAPVCQPCDICNPNGGE